MILIYDIGQTEFVVCCYQCGADSIEPRDIRDYKLHHPQWSSSSPPPPPLQTSSSPFLVFIITTTTTYKRPHHHLFKFCLPIFTYGSFSRFFATKQCSVMEVCTVQTDSKKFIFLQYMINIKIYFYISILYFYMYLQ